MNESWLSQLAPDHAPPPLGWWPLAPGWWGVIAALLMALAAGIWWWRRPSFRRWQRTALRELAQLQSASTRETTVDATIARDVQQLLRRYAVVRYGRETVAALNGDAWIAFVVNHGGTDWAGDTGRRLLHCAYGGKALAQGDAATDRQRWLGGARAFLKAGR
ncbi:MAG: DUF4381 domain-containing protein [Burkholderiaceae bacterium]|nr:DUF4381 domain-containing protein [Burkholderiaceae bacterium]